MGWVVSFKMKAMVMTGFGSPDVFELREIPKPQIKAGHVIIRVRASSVNPIDYKIRSGLLRNLAPENGVLGFDVSGIIEEVGDGAVSYTHLRAHETLMNLVCRLLLEKKK